VDVEGAEQSSGVGLCLCARSAPLLLVGLVLVRLGVEWSGTVPRAGRMTQ
jgi:hypothetical protein